MSKTSNKAKIEQLKDWLEWRKQNSKKSFIASKKPRESRSDYYKQQQAKGYL